MKRKIKDSRNSWQNNDFYSELKSMGFGVWSSPKSQFACHNKSYWKDATKWLNRLNAEHRFISNGIRLGGL